MFKKAFIYMGICALAVSLGAKTLEENFKTPPKEFRPYTMWWMNGEINQATIDDQIGMISECGFGGITPLALIHWKPSTVPAYPTPEYFAAYEKIVEKCKDLGLQMIFYDDGDFPSGIAGGTMAQHKGKLQKQIWQGRFDGGQAVPETNAPEGDLRAVLARNKTTGKWKDITKECEYFFMPEDKWEPARGHGRDGGAIWIKKTVRWNRPDKDYDVYVYICAEIPGAHVVDCLDPKAVEFFMTLTYDKMDAVLKNKHYWGDIIKSTFFDDQAIYYVQDFSQWSNTVDEAFKKKFGHYPSMYYPYLFDNGVDDEKSGAARSMMLDIRSELFAYAYPGTTEKWAKERGMTAAGHPAGSYQRDPLVYNCDPLKFYKYAGAVLMDSIHRKDLAPEGAKVPCSSAINYDKEMVYCETYGNFQPAHENDGLMLYRGAIDMYARGVNCIIAHGTWLTPERMGIVPEISWRNPAMAGDLPGYTEWAGRIQSVMQGGRNVADLAVVYPIRTLEANHKFRAAPLGEDNRWPYSDYMDVANIITGGLKRGFHYLHPEVIAEKCKTKNGAFVLPNKIHPQQFKAVILPMCQYMNLPEMKKIKEFHDAGGLVIATGFAPEKSADLNVADAEIQKLSDAIFKNGKGILVTELTQENLQKALDSRNIAWNFLGSSDLPEENKADIAYINYRKDGRDFYFTGNSSKQDAKATLKIRGKGNWEMWNPHTGEISKATPKYEKLFGEDYAVFNLDFAPGKAAFITRKLKK